MSRAFKQLMQDESGSEVVEWIVVTLILILAIYAILQAVGPEINALLNTLLAKLRP